MKWQQLLMILGVTALGACGGEASSPTAGDGNFVAGADTPSGSAAASPAASARADLPAAGEHLLGDQQARQPFVKAAANTRTVAARAASVVLDDYALARAKHDSAQMLPTRLRVPGFDCRSAGNGAPRPPSKD